MKQELKSEAKTENPHKNHRERMRNKLFEFGLESLSEHEIVEMLLYYTIKQQNTNEKAHELINKFGSLGALFDAPLLALRECNLSDNAIALFKIITQCMPIYYSSVSKDEVYDNTDKLKRLFLYQYPGKHEEHLLLACFTPKLNLIDNHIYVVSCGNNHFTEVNMRKMVEIIIGTKTNLVAISHNHPGGVPDPSKHDIFATRKISRNLKSIDVTLLDHITVGKDSAYSMREHNIIGVFD
jgi:DNA repair protein RadC